MQRYVGLRSPGAELLSGDAGSPFPRSAERLCGGDALPLSQRAAAFLDGLLKYRACAHRQAFSVGLNLARWAFGGAVAAALVATH
jgi:hypothetical protein